jgi:hypothetical protein
MSRLHCPYATTATLRPSWYDPLCDFLLLSPISVAHGRVAGSNLFGPDLKHIVQYRLGIPPPNKFEGVTQSLYGDPFDGTLTHQSKLVPCRSGGFFMHRWRGRVRQR